MLKKVAASYWSKKFTEPVKRFSEWRGGIGVVILILLLALASRTIDLSSFPYFPTDWPWNGRNGLYIDELDISVYLYTTSVYFPFLQIALMTFVIQTLGYATFSIRFVSAVFSSVTSVLVYLAAKELFHNKLPAFISSLYFIFMTPALIYGRMALVDNGATTFLVATFLCCIKFLNTSRSEWLLGAAVSAGLSFLCKQTGIVALMFLVLFILAYKPDSIRLMLKLLLVAGLFMSTYLVEIVTLDPAYLGVALQRYANPGIRSVDWFNILMTTAMPTGHALMWHSFPEMLDYFWLIRSDFWYLLAYFVIGFLMFKKEKAAHMMVLAIASFAFLLILLGHGNVYYVALIQPFMAIPFGFGLMNLQKMSGPFAFAFSLFLCFPAITYISYYVSYFLIGGAATNTVWLIMQFTFVVPVVLIGILRLALRGISSRKALLVNRFLLLFYIMCLIVGSYLLPVFYPGYFAQLTVPR